MEKNSQLSFLPLTEEQRHFNNCTWKVISKSNLYIRQIAIFPSIKLLKDLIKFDKSNI